MGGRLCCSHHDPLPDSVRRPLVWLLVVMFSNVLVLMGGVIFEIRKLV